MAEISFDADADKLKALYSLEGVMLVQSSDAHYLENMKDACNTLELEQLSAAAVIRYFESKMK